MAPCATCAQVALQIEEITDSAAAAAETVVAGKETETAAAMATSEHTNRFQVLCYDQVARLHEVMQDAVPVHGRGNFPTLQIKLNDLVQVVRDKLLADGIKVRDIRLNGGAASYVLGCNDADPCYNDLDLIFGVDLGSQNELQKVKMAVLNSLLEFLPEGVNRDKMSSCSLKEAYVHKMVKVCNDADRWSLISLSNNKGSLRNVELKFVDTMKRQFEFSVDSFQIILDSLLTFYEISQTHMTEHFYPTVVAESVYGDFCEALYHLQKKLIATRCPEQIRGGGLLKYCNLLVKQHSPASNVDIKALERYMCSRFFIDFPDITQQRIKLENYLANHFGGEDPTKYDYLMTLYSVVDESTICLMGHERRQTLNLIQQLASQILLEQETKAYNKQLQLQQFDSQNFSIGPTLDQQSNLIIDQVFYGPYYGGSTDQYYPPTTYTYVPSASYPCPLCPPQPQYLQCS